MNTALIFPTVSAKLSAKWLANRPAKKPSRAYIDPFSDPPVSNMPLQEFLRIIDLILPMKYRRTVVAPVKKSCALLCLLVPPLHRPQALLYKGFRLMIPLYAKMCHILPNCAKNAYFLMGFKRSRVRISPARLHDTEGLTETSEILKFPPLPFPCRFSGGSGRESRWCRNPWWL